MSHIFPGTTSVNGGYQQPSSGPNNTAEYMASGLPFVSSTISSVTPLKIDFPYVTSELYLKVSGSTGESIRVGFTQAGIQGNNYFVVDSGASFPFRIRCKTLFIRSNNGTPSYSLMAAMTMVPNRSFPTLTGSAADPDTGLVKFNSGSNANEFGYKGLDQFPPA